MRENIATEIDQVLLDTYAWVEFFEGSDEGKKVEETIKSGNQIYTSILSLSEIVVWCLRNQRDIDKRLGIIKNYSEILDLNDKIAIIAGKINFEIKKTIKDFGMINSLIYATARVYSLELLTGDGHFRNLEHVVML